MVVAVPKPLNVLLPNPNEDAVVLGAVNRLPPPRLKPVLAVVFAPKRPPEAGVDDPKLKELVVVVAPKPEDVVLPKVGVVELPNPVVEVPNPEDVEVPKPNPLFAF